MTAVVSVICRIKFLIYVSAPVSLPFLFHAFISVFLLLVFVFTEMYIAESLLSRVEHLKIDVATFDMREDGW